MIHQRIFTFFNTVLYIPAYMTTFKVQKTTLKKRSRLMQPIEKSYLNFHMKIFYIKNALVRKNKECARKVFLFNIIHSVFFGK